MKITKISDVQGDLFKGFPKDWDSVQLDMHSFYGYIDKPEGKQIIFKDGKKYIAVEKDSLDARNNFIARFKRLKDQNIPFFVELDKEDENRRKKEYFEHLRQNRQDHAF